MLSTTGLDERQSGDLHRDIAHRRTDLVALRRHFHMHPELAWEEHATAEMIAQRLRATGLDVREGVGRTGVTGLLRGAEPGKTLLIRADIDALPIEERNETEYVSRVPGTMHACGHDGHAAIALILADMLAQRRDQLAGNVKFAFQPAEEQASGAAPMIADGVLHDPEVDAVIGLHLWSPLRVGHVIVQEGPIFASADSITLKVRGSGGHGAMPHLNVDPIVAAAHIVTSAQSLVSREMSPFHTAVVTFGMIHGGTAGNVIADEVELGGTIRAYSQADRDHLVSRLRELADHIATSLRASAELIVGAGVGPCVNDPSITAIVRRAAIATVGEDHLFAGDGRQSVSDDMAVFLESVPGCYFLIGVGNPERGITAPHHSNRFDIDEDALAIGTEIMARATLDFLSGR